MHRPPVERWHLLYQAMRDLDCESYIRGLLLLTAGSNASAAAVALSVTQTQQI
jgi:hypothetical protein